MEAPLHDDMPPPAATETPETVEKLRRVRDFLSRRGLDALLLRRSANAAWLVAGGRTYINIAAETGVGSLLVTRDARYLLTDVIEARRLAEEEGFEREGWQIVAEPWHEPGRQLAAITKGLRVGSDWPGDAAQGLEDVGGEVARLRWHLTEPEAARYRDLGRDVGAAIGTAAREVRPGMTEHEIAGLLGRAGYALGAVPVVVLVATDERMDARRHPLPTDKRLERTAMLVLCARRHGLVTSLTRIVSFGPVSDDRRRRMRAVAAIEAAALAATRPGARANDIFGQIVEAYAREGFPGEWAFHHQGGAAGYEARDYIANPGVHYVVEPLQAFAWNPSVPGAKSEDTFIVSEAGAELLSPTPDWPYIQVETGIGTIQRPDILEL